MSYLTFKPSNGRAKAPKLVKRLSVLIDATVILLMVWTIVNMCYPFWDWVTYASIWVGFFSFSPLHWLNRHNSLRLFKTAEYRYNDLNVTDSGRLKHSGFFFSVWDHPDALTLGRYHVNDRLGCRKERTVCLGYEIKLNRWLGWPIVLITDFIPFILFAAVFSAGYFLGIGVLIFYLTGLILGLNVTTIAGGLAELREWDDVVFLEGKIYIRRSVGLTTCILEGPDGELILTMLEVLMFSHFTKRLWLKATAEAACPCCMSMMDPALRNYLRAYRQLYRERPVFKSSHLVLYE
jgi:hypothetical protein